MELALAGFVLGVVAAVAIAALLRLRARRRARDARRAPSERGRPRRERGAAAPESPPEELATGEPLSAEPPAPGPATTEPSASASSPPVRFTVHHPQELPPGEWRTLLAYVHLPGVEAAIAKDARARLEREHAHGRRRAEAERLIARGAEIAVRPELPGCRFNPPRQQVLWLEDWHRAEFRVQALPPQRGSGEPGAAEPRIASGGAVNGRVAFYVESVLVGEVPIWGLISAQREIAAGTAALEASAGDPYAAIFVSYAHDEAEVAERLGRAYKALGMTFLRDVEVLRSGEAWNPRLLELIPRADIFQLYWSEAARRSPYVEQEWRHALAQDRESFIRPVYWKKPLAPPPAELAHLHFSYLPD